MQVSVIGLGAMGQHIAANLLAAGHEVTVWNRSPARADRLAELGAHKAQSPQEAFSSDVVLNTLFDDTAVKSVLIDDDALSGAGDHTIHVCMATISTRLVDELLEQHRERGVAYVAAPMFGRPDMAAQARLNLAMAAAPELRDAVEPVLQCLGTPWHLGDDPRIGHLAKVTGNFMIGCAIETLAEGTALVRSRSGDAGPFISMLTQTLFAAPVFQSYGTAITRDEFPSEPSGLLLPLKDIGLTLDEARAANLGLPLARLLHERLSRAGDQGLMVKDWSIALAHVAAATAHDDDRMLSGHQKEANS